MLTRLRNALHTLQHVPGSFHSQAEIHERQLMLSGRQAAWSLRDKTCIKDLSEAEFRVFSQWGEDGILEWLIQSLSSISTTFVEFGVENYMEANTRFLIQNRNWKGLIMDGSAAHMDYVRTTPLYWKYDLNAVAAFITRENINTLLTAHNFSGDLGVLSIDIDGNDYWILDAVDVARAAILVVEYNPILGDTTAITVPYNPEFNRFDAHYSGLYFGASITAIRQLAKEKGYTLVGTCSNGINAFFVRDDLFVRLDGKLQDVRVYPSRHRDSRDVNGQLSFTSGMDRIRLIEDMPVFLVEEGREVALKQIPGLYSEQWLTELDGQPIPND